MDGDRLSNVRGIRSEEIPRERVPSFWAGITDPHWFVEAAGGMRFGRGVPPDDLGQRGRAFSARTELRWDGDSALMLSVTDEPDAEARPATGTGLEEETLERVLPCARGAEAPGLGSCPWQSIVAHRVLSDGAETFLRFADVRARDTANA